jgi:hypothetical protein
MATLLSIPCSKKIKYRTVTINSLLQPQSRSQNLLAEALVDVQQSICFVRYSMCDAELLELAQLSKYSNAYN